jgi:pilus assembly protein CpaE
VIDTWSYLDDIVLGAMDLADRIVVVMNPEIPSIKATKQFFDIAEALEFPIDHLDLVLNKVGVRDGIRPQQIERSMNHPLFAQLEEDPRAMRQSVNQGLPLIVGQPNTPLAQAYAELADHALERLAPQAIAQTEEAVEEREPDRAKRPGLFGRLRR